MNRKPVDLEKLKFLREKNGLSITEVSKYLGYKTPNGYLYLESGKCAIKAETLPLLAELFGVSINELYCDYIPTVSVVRDYESEKSA